MSRNPLLWLLLVTGAGACTLPLDDQPVTGSLEPEPTTLAGCPLFADVTTTLGFGRSVTMTDGETLWSLDGAWPSQGRSDGVVVLAAPASDTCGSEPAAVQSAVPATATDHDFATPLDVVRAGDSIWQFYEAWHFDASQPFGVRVTGRGVARWNPQTRQFERAPQLLWLADRPNYGVAAIQDGVWVYAYGCAGTDDGWSRACYVARAPVLQLDDVHAWRYASAVGTFTDSVDAAQPVLVGVGDVAVRRHASGRLLVTYIAPLDTTLHVRSALAPTGPFSAPHVLGRCDAPADVFCVGAAQHPQLDGDPQHIALTWARASFQGLDLALAGPQFQRVALPDALP